MNRRCVFRKPKALLMRLISMNCWRPGRILLSFPHWKRVGVYRTARCRQLGGKGGLGLVVSWHPEIAIPAGLDPRGRRATWTNRLASRLPARRSVPIGRWREFEFEVPVRFCHDALPK